MHCLWRWVFFDFHPIKKCFDEATSKLQPFCAIVKIIIASFTYDRVKDGLK